MKPPANLSFLMIPLRSLLRRPTTSLLAVVMLAIGIGASTALFSLMAPVLLRPMGIAEGDRVVQVYRSIEGDMEGTKFAFEHGLPPDEVRVQQADNRSLAAVANASVSRFVVRAGEQDSRYLQGSVVSSGYFGVMGVTPWLGRAFTPDEDLKAEPEVLISYALWQGLFGGERQVIGKMLQVNSRPCRILGVMPRGFAGHHLGERMDLWLPEGARAEILPPNPQADGSVSSSEPTLARLRPGASLAQAEAAFRALGSGFQRGGGRPGMKASPITLSPFAKDRASVMEARLPAPWLMLSVAGSLLLLACANVANLQLAQLESRRQEFATRVVLGAKPGAIVRGVLGENLLLSLGAGVLGLALAQPFMQGIQSIRDVKVYEMTLPATLSPEAFLFAFLLVLLTGLAVGLLPAYQASRVQLAQVLKDASSTLTTGSRLKDALVVLQVALALSLMTGGALVSRGLDRARGAALGYRTAGVAGARIEFPETWPTSRRNEALKSLHERVSALPGVRSASWGEGMPMEVGKMTITVVQGRTVRLQGVGPGYFAAVGLEVVGGREFTTADLEGRGRLVNQALAQQLWPGQDPVGREFAGCPILGVVQDHAMSPKNGLHEPMLFRPIVPDEYACLLFRTDAMPERIFPSVRQILRNIDPDLPLLQITTLEAHLDRLHHHLRVASWLLGFCGLVSLVLSTMGVQSLLVFKVACQAREIGLRMALGALPGQILRQVVLRGMQSVTLGLALGCVGSFWVGRVFHHLFVGIDPLDPQSLFRALAVLLIVSLLACLLPALRAANIQPAESLRRN